MSESRCYSCGHEQGLHLRLGACQGMNCATRSDCLCPTYVPVPDGQAHPQPLECADCGVVLGPSDEVSDVGDEGALCMRCALTPSEPDPDRGREYRLADEAGAM